MALGPRAAPANDYLADSRTAAAVRFASPRASLGHCLHAVGAAAGLSLTASPELAEEALTGYVPRRPLRETMQALEELFDAAWAEGAGGYVLKPEPARRASLLATRGALLKKQRAALDAAAGEAAAAVRAGRYATNHDLRPVFALALWARLAPAERERVLLGTPVTLSISEGAAAELYRLLLAISMRERTPLTGPLLATFDLEDLADRGTPTIRARATALRTNGVTGAIGTLEFVPADRKAPLPPETGPLLPAGIGDNGQIGGTRDEVILKLGQAAELPILSRHRAIGGSAGVAAAGRPVAAVMADLAAPAELDALYHPTARGYHLFRSATEWIDRATLPAAGPVQAYLSGRPWEKRIVPFQKLLPLAQLTPVQLAVLERSNLCTNEAHAARELYALMQFHLSLSKAQQEALFSAEGLDASACTHAQLHQLLAGKDKRADWDVEGGLQNPAGLRLRLREMPSDMGRSLIAEAVRAGAVLSSGSAELPVAEPEDEPQAARD